MFSQILAPVDLAHVDRLERALCVAADLAKHYGIPVCYAAVTAPTPGPVAHNPKEFGEKLAAFAADQSARYGHTATSRALVSHDPSVDLDQVLLSAVDETGSDLVVMASHVPGVKEFLLPSHGGRMATHSRASVLIVRDQ